MMKHKKIIAALSVVAVVGLAAVLGLTHGVNGEVSGEESPWQVRCQEATEGEAQPEGRGSCEMFQRLVHGETQSRIVEIAIGYPADQEDARGIIILPLGILLPTGVQFKVDEGDTYAIDVRYCNQGGCYAHVNLPTDVIDELSGGKQATITFHTTAPQQVNINLSLTGFRKALQGIS